MKKSKKKEKKDYTTLIVILIVIGIFATVILGAIFSPRYYKITTGLYNMGTKEDQKNVETAMGTENTEERFEIYFEWYNVVHELGHGLLKYNDGVKLHVVDEEQLVNDFAVAYWNYYGEESKVNELRDIANYAVEHVGTNYINNVDYIKLGKENSTGISFDPSFFNFNDYGWFQFSSVKHSFEENKDLETVLKEMGFKDFKLNDKKVLVYEDINEETSTKIINDAVNNIKEWGFEFPEVIHKYSNDPNNNTSQPIIKFLGIIELPDIGRLI